MKIGVIGDLILTPRARFDDALLKKLLDTDLNIANLESPFVNDTFKKNQRSGGLHQLMNHCGQLKELNIKIVSLANNHIFDFGEAGLHETIHTLEKENIGYFGAGASIEEAAALKEIRLDGRTVAIGGGVSAYIKPHVAKSKRPGTAGVDEKQAIKLLDSSNADIKILYNHWNQEYEDYPEPLYLDMAGRLIEHCNCIIGGHPHCIQGIQEKDGKYIIHSLGNFTMPHQEYHQKSLGRFPDHCYEAFFVILHINTKNQLSYELVAYKILDDGNHIALMSKEEEKAFLNKCEIISKPLTLEFKEYFAFYRRVKRRKFRPVLRKNHIRNQVSIWLTFRTLYFIRFVSTFFARVFDVLGVRRFIRKRFAFILDRLFKL